MPLSEIRVQRVNKRHEAIGFPAHGGDNNGDFIAAFRLFRDERATWRMRSKFATDVPPNFMTMRATCGAPLIAAKHYRTTAALGSSLIG